jgi:hypothetical protein
VQENAQEDVLAPVEGELWLASAPAGERIVVAILMVERESAHEPICSVALVSNDLEMASDQSLCFASGEAAPFALMVCLDLVGPALRSDLVRRVGRLPLERELFLRAALEDEFDPALAARRGLRLRGRDDPRWNWTVREMDWLALRLLKGRLTAD